jgi:hypothetical protein
MSDLIEAMARAYAEANGYYVDFHPGLSSPSADKIRSGMTAALAALRETLEPVGWMYVHEEFGCEIHTDRWGKDTGGTSDDYIGWTEQALYALEKRHD